MTAGVEANLLPVMTAEAEMPPDPAETARIEAALGKLMRGLVHGSWELAYASYQDLHACGPAVIPILEGWIFQADWTRVTRPETTRVQMGLVTLLHDVDEARSQAVTDRLLAQDCHPALRGALQSIRRYDSRNFTEHEICGLRVLLDKDIDDSEDLPTHLARWLANVPPRDLANIERLYVVPYSPLEGTAGHYMPILSTITLRWMNFSIRHKPLPWLAYPILSWTERFSMEHTLYHEIGHHVHRHTFGQQPEQEREANRYALGRLRVSRPVLAAFVRAVWFVTRLFVALGVLDKSKLRCRSR